MNKFKGSFWITAVLALILSGPMGLSQTPHQRGRAALDGGGTLHEAAIASGGTYIAAMTTNNGWLAFDDLKDLTRVSKIVVIGTPVENVARVSSDGKAVSTYYQIRVERRLKGKFGEGDTLRVALPGGKVRFDDGTTAQINTPDFPKMINGNRYLLYLNPAESNPSGAPDLVPAGGSQGIFELKADGKVLPFARSGIDPLGKYAGAEQAAFVDRAEGAVDPDPQ